MIDPLLFPAGVRSGSPFSSAPAARDWLVAAADGAFGPLDGPGVPLMRGLSAWSAPGLDRPLYPTDLPDDLAEQAMSDAHFAAAPSRGEWRVPFVPVGDWLPAAAFLAYRTMTGAEILMRARFDDAEKPERRRLAPILAQYENAALVAAGVFISSANRWVTTAWRDALNGSVPVVPDPTPGTSPHTVFKPSPVGVVRLGTL
jgi:hypothetical protein